MRRHTSPALLYLFFTFFLFAACSGGDETEGDRPSGELIARKSGDRLFIPPPQKSQPPLYPWDEYRITNLSKITKEFFRCKGTHLNPERVVERSGKPLRLEDCGGSERHSLPLKDGREFIYPILITLLNHIQVQTGKRVVITSGHRCPEHNTYVDHSIANTYSKHMIGAEVSFFVQGLEDQPQKIVDLILDYYQHNSPYKEDPEFTTFQRYEKSDTNVTTKPWFNKEVFIKLFKSSEGRNFDNRHPYPYIAIQVRYDSELKERVVYSWDKAYKNYLRK